MIKVSVIVPVYNAQKYLNKCITSLVNQTLKDIEILIINDGSTDNSLNIINEYASKYEGMIKVFNKENGGPGSARNVGLDNATGEYIKFVDADDYLDTDILGKMYNIAIENKVSIVRGNYNASIGIIKIKDQWSWSDIQDNQVVDINDYKDYIVAETPGIGNKLIKRDLIGDLRFPENSKWEDLAIIPYLLASSERIYHMNENVYNYRMNMNTTTRDFIKVIPNLLDIIKSVEEFEHHMKDNNLLKEYQEQVEGIYVLHTLFRVQNVMHWLLFSKNKKKIIISSLLGLLDNKYSNWEKNRLLKVCRIKNKMFNRDMKKLNKYVDSAYRLRDKDTLVNNINISLKKV